MPRYTSWFRRSLDNRVTGLAKDIGKKMLGRLAHRRDHGGPPTLVERHIMADGTTIEAKFVGGIPQLSIRTPETPEGETLCEMYVESGLLDLGPNIAADASERFNRGLPEFDDSPAMLYFGDAISCADKLNGKIRLSKRKLSSQCLGEFGSDPTPSRLTDPAKKQAQAVLPASCWTGLMHRYVAAIYGGNQIDYRLSEDYTLQILDGEDVVADIDPFGDPSSWGLLNFDGELRFIEIETTTGFGAGIKMRIYDAEFTTPCAEAIYSLWKRMPKESESGIERANKILTIALSHCRPARTHRQESDLGETEDPVGSWAFATHTPKAANVFITLSEDPSYLVEAEFYIGGDGNVGVLFTTETGDNDPVVVMARPQKGSFELKVENSSGRISFGEYPEGGDYDTPIYCWYDVDDLVVVRAYKSKQETESISGLTRSISCGLWEYPIKTIEYSGGYNSSLGDYVRPPVPSAGNQYAGLFEPFVNVVFGGCHQPSPYPDDVACTLSNSEHHNTAEPDAGTADVATGMYAVKNGVTVWSDIHTVATVVRANNGNVYAVVQSRKRENERTDSCVSPQPTTTDGIALDPYDGSTTVPSPSHQDIFGGVPLRSTPPECVKYGRDNLTAAPGSEFGCCQEVIEGYQLAFGPDFNGTTTAEVFYNVWEEEAVILLGRTQCLPSKQLISPWGDRSDIISRSYTLRGFAGHRFEVRTTHKQITASRRHTVGTIDCTYTPDPGPGDYLHFECPYEYDNTVAFTQYTRSADFLPYRDPAPLVGCEFPSVRPPDVVIAYGVETLKSATNVSSGGTSWAMSKDVNVPYSGTTVGADFSSSPCYPSISYLLDIPETDDHFEFKTGVPLHAVLDGEDDRVNLAMVNEFHYRAARSLLGAKITPIVDENFGYSVDMDRETISGGYTKVSWPSFVGWA